MSLLKNKKFQAGIAATTIAAMLASGLLVFNIFSKADNHSTDGINYSSIMRDTSISTDSEGNLNISRTEQSGETMGKEDSWTLFVYITGSDLESDYENATKDIKEMIAAKYNADNLNIIIQTGGSEVWHTKGVSSDSIGRYKINGNNLELIEEHPNASMGDSQTLYSFLNWGVKNYPAEHMGVVFWNHGSGVSEGLCIDTVHNYDSLSLGEVEYAFAKLNNKMTDSFELIGFDTCLSGSLEYANVLTPYAKYMVASADIEPGDGWDYTPVINYIIDNPDATGAEVGQEIADSYYDFYSQYEEDKDYVTMAVYDLSKTDEVCKEFNLFAKYMDKELDTRDSEAFADLAVLINDCMTYEKLNIDLGSLIEALQNSDRFSYETSDLQKALNDFLVYYNIGAEYSNIGCTGITVYLPVNTLRLSELNMYRNAGFSPYWLNVLEYLVAKVSDKTLRIYEPNNWEDNEYFFEDNFGFIPYDDTTLNTTSTYENLYENDDYVSNGFVENWNALFTEYGRPTYQRPNDFNPISMEMMRSTKSPTLTTTLNSTDNVAKVFQTLFATIDGETVCLGENADVAYNTQTGKVSSSFTGEWFTLPDGQLLTTYVVSSNNNSVIYGFPVVINEVESTIRVKETTDANGNKDYNVLGVWDATEDSLYAPRGFLPLNEGTTITPIYDVFNEETETYETSYGDDYTISSDSDFLFTTLEDGDYSFAYTIARTFGDDLYTSSIDFSLIDGKMSPKEQ